MNRSIRTSSRRMTAFACLLLSVSIVTAALALAQAKKPTQEAGVDNTRLGAYRALAEVSFQIFQKGDIVTAAKLATCIERTWDKGEEHGGNKALRKTNPKAFAQIDHAMDMFIKPLMHYAENPPDRAVVEAGYKEFLDKLAQADSNGL